MRSVEETHFGALNNVKDGERYWVLGTREHQQPGITRLSNVPTWRGGTDQLAWFR
jgi:hypothetical protein